jgi:hypothetical protein
MYDKIKSSFFYISIVTITCLFLWNLYTVTFHGYVTNGVWETYYEEEPNVFVIDFIEIFGMYIPLFIILGFHMLGVITDRFRGDAPTVSAAIKAKRLRRKKRKKKRKQ